MFKLLKSLIRSDTDQSDDTPIQRIPPADKVQAPGVAPFDVRAALLNANGLPLLDWSAVQRWVDCVPNAADQEEAWSACERAWLDHLCIALGQDFQVRTQGQAILLSTLESNLAEATLAFVNKTVQRIVRVLDGVASTPEWGHDILIVFEDDESYYKYVSYYYPEAGEFASSSGMYINDGCGHFVTMMADLRAIEPVITHELTHACLSHLPIPAWLNEGLAVNTELRLCPPPQEPLNPRHTHARHRMFWGEEEIQQFWSGKSFLRNDEGNELSYDLARILVSQFGTDWENFRRFALAANIADSGTSAAREHLGIDLGTTICALLENEHTVAWAPMPETWGSEPERGAFRLILASNLVSALSFLGSRT